MNLPASAGRGFSSCARILERYNIDVWKIFEYMHYDSINPSLKSPENAKSIIEELKKTIKNKNIVVRYESCKTRNNRYFMINPNGAIVIPTRRTGNICYERNIGSIIGDIEPALSEWGNTFNGRNYSDSIEIFNWR